MKMNLYGLVKKDGFNHIYLVNYSNTEKLTSGQWMLPRMDTI